MPLTLTPKASKSKLRQSTLPPDPSPIPTTRRKPPPPLDLSSVTQSQRTTVPGHRHSQYPTQPPISPLPTPPSSAGASGSFSSSSSSSSSSGSASGSGSGFKMFSWKKKAVPSDPKPYYPAELPRPILKTQSGNTGSGSSIRFESSPGAMMGAGAGVSGVDIQARRQEMIASSQGGQPLFQREPPPSMLTQPKIAVTNIAQRQSQTWEASSSSAFPLRSNSVSSTVSSSFGYEYASQCGHSQSPVRGSSPRRSSRPASPSASSFGSRVRTESAPAIVLNGTMLRFPQPQKTVAAAMPAAPCAPSVNVMATPPMPSSHITTPPMAYASTMHSRAPPPPSPYRPTVNHERRISLSRALPERLPMTTEMAPRPPRESSLFANYSSISGSDPRSSIITVQGINVPMLNIIPATPQETYEEFTGSWTGPKRKRLSGPGEAILAEAATLDDLINVDLGQHREMEMQSSAGEPIHIDEQAGLPHIPSIDVSLDFSPFTAEVELPLSDSDEEGDEQHIEHSAQRPTYTRPSVLNQVEESEAVPAVEVPYRNQPAPTQPLPSPPFESYPSLPSLESHASMPTSSSDVSMPSSQSSASLLSFPDVEEALGSMLASLSDTAFPPTSSINAELNTYKAKPANPGLGLGLDMLPAASISITAPLSPRKARDGTGVALRNRARPPPIDVELARSAPGSGPQEISSAPPRINHRVAFYGTAKAHPNSPSSGIFTQMMMMQPTEEIESPTSSFRSLAEYTQNHEVPEAAEESMEGSGNYRDDHSDSVHSHESSASTARFSAGSLTSGGQLVGLGLGSGSCRDSVSLASESSDEDLYTASIISLAPVGGSGSGNARAFVEVREEVIVDDVGLAL